MITIKEIKEMARTVQAGRSALGTRVRLFEKLRKNQRKAIQFYNLDFQFKVHENFEKLKLPTSRRMIDQYMSHLPLSNPVIEVIPFKDKNPYRNRAIKQQEFSNALLRLSMEQSDNPIFNGAKDLGLRGELFFKLVEDVQTWQNGLEKRKGETNQEYEERQQAWRVERMPIKIFAPDPMTCYPSPDHTDCRPDDILQIYRLPVRIVKQIFPKWKSTKLDTALVGVVEYWSPSEYVVLADDTPATDGIEPNRYGFVPYVHIYSGWGVRDEQNTPESKAVSLLFGLYDRLIAQCRWFSYLDTAVQYASMPMLEAEGERQDYEEAPKPFPGMTTYGGENKRVKIIFGGENFPVGLLQAIGLEERTLERTGQPAILGGAAPRGVAAGYPMALMIGQARLLFGIALENLQTATARVLELSRLLIRDVIKEEVPIWGENKLITLSPTDCEGAYRYNVKYDATTPEGRANRALVGQRLRQGGSISLETELKVWHNIKNPEKEIYRMRAESLTKHPALERIMAMEAVRAIKGEEQAALIEQLMAEGEEGAIRKARAEGIGVPEGRETPEDVLKQAMGRRHAAMRGEPEEEVAEGAFD